MEDGFQSIKWFLKSGSKWRNFLKLNDFLSFIDNQGCWKEDKTTVQRIDEMWKIKTENECPAKWAKKKSRKDKQKFLLFFFCFSSSYTAGVQILTFISCGHKQQTKWVTKRIGCFARQRVKFP